MALPSDTGAYYLLSPPEDATLVRAAWPGAVIGEGLSRAETVNAVQVVLRNAHTLYTHHNSAILAAAQGVTSAGVEVAIHEIDNSGGGGASGWEVALVLEVQLVEGRTDLNLAVDYEGGNVRARVYDSGGAVGGYTTLSSSASRTQDSDLLDAAAADPDTCYVEVEVQAMAGDVAMLYYVAIREQWA